MAARFALHAAELALLERGEGRYNGVRRDFERRMQQALETAQDNAPVASGDYRDHLHLETDTASDGFRVMLGGASSHDYEVEDRHGVLVRALDAAGGS